MRRWPASTSASAGSFFSRLAQSERELDGVAPVALSQQPRLAGLGFAELPLKRLRGGAGLGVVEPDQGLAQP